MKNDFLSDALRRGDPAGKPRELQTIEERKAALLARCAAGPLVEPAHLPVTAQAIQPRKTRWAFPALAGAGTLTVAALYGAIAWFGASNPASQTAPTPMVQISPHPSTTPAPRKPVPTTAPRPVSSGDAIVQERNTKKPTTHRDTNVADYKPAGHATRQTISTRPPRQNDAPPPAPTKTLVRANRKGNASGPRLIADAKRSQATPALSQITEPVVERVIIEQDATPAESAQIVTSVAITINGRTTSRVVSRAAESAAN